MVIIPAILVTTRKEVEDYSNKIVNLLDHAQVDICDGKYVSSMTWPLTEKKDIQDKYLPNWEHIDYSADIMCENPSEVLELCLEYGFAEVIFHFRSLKLEHTQKFSEISFTKYIEDLFAKVALYEMRLGVALDHSTDIMEVEEFYKKFIDVIDYVQVMGIKNIGKQRQDFATETSDIIKRFKLLGAMVCVDGGVNEDSIQQINEAGADAVVVGSALDLAGSNYLENYDRLQKKVEN